MKKIIFLASILTALTLSAGEPHPWIHVFSKIQDFNSVKVDDNLKLTHDLMNHEITLANDHTSATINVSTIDSCVVGTNVPTIYITTPSQPDLTEVRDKVNFVDALISIDGNGLFDDIETTEVLIRGRGNDTWNYDKKPYRLKFSKKIELPGCRKAKNFCLIANYIDCTLMRDAIAYKAANLLGIPYSSSCQPVRVYFNGILKGAYFLTEKIGISSASVNIDENTGMLFELDANFDEDFKFRSEAYDLPVMVKDPDIDEIAETQGKPADEIFNAWKADFNAFASKILDGTAIAGVDYDLQSLVDYMIVYNIACNQEPNHPKSLFIHKKSIGEPYIFGPVWDFDWAFTYLGGKEIMPATEMMLDPDPGQGGGYMLIDLCKTPEFRAAYAARWEEFKKNAVPVLFDYIDSYADAIRPSAIENGVLWPAKENKTIGSFDFDNNVTNLKKWLLERIEFISTHPNFALYADK